MWVSELIDNTDLFEPPEPCDRYTFRSIVATRAMR